MNDDDRAAILARRRAFIALALAGGTATVAAGAYVVFSPCLSPVAPDGGTAGPCLSLSIVEPDAGIPDAGPPDAGAPDSGQPDAGLVASRPPRRDPPPMACLSVAMPDPTEPVEEPKP